MSYFFLIIISLVSKVNFIAKRLCTIDTEESKQYKKTKLCTERQQLYNFKKGTGTSYCMLYVTNLSIRSYCKLYLKIMHFTSIKCALAEVCLALLSFNKIVLGAWLIKIMNKERKKKKQRCIALSYRSLWSPICGGLWTE